MKRMMRPIPVSAWSDIDGTLHPFRLHPGVQRGEIKIGRIVDRSQTKIAGRLSQTFLCQTDDKLYEIEYDHATHCWYLTKW
ncbi:MAG: hypothetical protein FWE76_07485 [Symbiobacteriaceae bacterium]|nr:hypothetical protein [Symbiobacteriaceae bacterium]